MRQPLKHFLRLCASSRKKRRRGEEMKGPKSPGTGETGLAGFAGQPTVLTPGGKARGAGLSRLLRVSGRLLWLGCWRGTCGGTDWHWAHPEPPRPGPVLMEHTPGLTLQQRRDPPEHAPLVSRGSRSSSSVPEGQAFHTRCWRNGTHRETRPPKQSSTSASHGVHRTQMRWTQCEPQTVDLLGKGEQEHSRLSGL